MAKKLRDLTSDINVMERETAMAMATISSLDDGELRKPTLCEGWTRGHLIGHLVRGADAMTSLATWAVTGRETPEADADLEVRADSSAAELTAALKEADARLLEVVRALRNGVQMETLPTTSGGEITAFSLPSRRTTEVIVHHNDLDTTGDLHAAPRRSRRRQLGNSGEQAPGLSRRPRACGSSPARARNGSSATAGTGSRPTAPAAFLARGQVDDGLRYEGELPSLPPW